MRSPKYLLAAVLVLSSCGGGSEDLGTADTDTEPVATDASPGTDDTGADDTGTDGVGTDGAASTDGSNDDATTSIPGADVDLEGLQESVGEMIDQLNTGEGGGTVTVADVTYTVDAEVCIVQGTDLTVEGLATGSDGSSAWVSVSHSVMHRDEMAAHMDEQALKILFADAETVTDASVSVSVGQTDMFGAGTTDDQPSWYAAGGGSMSFDNSSLEFQVADDGASGSGQAVDENGVAIPYGEVAPITFDVGCS